MFTKFDDDQFDALTLPQFKRFTYAIGMDFINEHYKSGIGYLFETEENPSKSRVTFAEFMQFVTDNSTFKFSEQEFRQAMEILDQEGEGKEAQIDDIKRVLKSYSNLTEE